MSNNLQTVCVRLTEGQILTLVNEYIGCSGGYLGLPERFTYRTLKEFYPQYCDISGVDPDKSNGTTRDRFIHILFNASPMEQAKIIRGIFKRFPPQCTVPDGLPLSAFGEDVDCVREVRRRECILREFLNIADKLESSSLSDISSFTDSAVVLAAIISG